MTGSKSRNRTVYERADGRWANRRDGAARDSSVHATQEEAIEVAMRMLEKRGGGELTVKGAESTDDQSAVAPP